MLINNTLTDKLSNNNIDNTRADTVQEVSARHLSSSFHVPVNNITTFREYQTLRLCRAPTAQFFVDINNIMIFFFVIILRILSNVKMW